MNRRNLIKGIGIALCAGLTPSFIPSLVSVSTNPDLPWVEAVYDSKGKLYKVVMHLPELTRTDFPSDFPSGFEDIVLSEPPRFLNGR